MNILISSQGKLTKSTLISAVLHLAAAAVLFSKPLHLHPRFSVQIGKAPAVFEEEGNIVVLKRNQALEEAFSHLEPAPLKPTFTPSEIGKILSAEKLPGFEALPPAPSPTLALPKFSIESMPLPFIASLKEQEVALPLSSTLSERASSVAEPSILPTKVPDFSEYTHELPIVASSKEVPMNFSFIPSQENAASMYRSSATMSVPGVSGNLQPSLGAPTELQALDEKISLSFTVSSDFTMKPLQPALIVRHEHVMTLGDYGFPFFHLKEWNEFFDVDVKTYPQEEGGFLFSLNLIPKQDLSEYRLKQNFLFIIDRSNSIDRHRYQAFKRAALRAISSLREGDYFNVLLLDAKVTSFSNQPLPFTKSNQQKAEEFLEKQSHGHFGAATDIYSSLMKVLEPLKSSEEAITGILISDGDSPLKSDQQRKKINNWLEANQDRMTLYTATAGQGNNLSSLKMLSLASRGSLLYSDTHAAFPRKLAKLVMDLRYPIAKEMTVSLIPSDPSACFEILPPSARLPYLFSDHPYVIMGSCSKLTDFTLIVEGKNKDEVLTVKKEVSLSKAKPGSKLLSKQWACEKAHTFFDQYLKEGKSSLLEKAEKDQTHLKNRRS